MTRRTHFTLLVACGLLAGLSVHTCAWPAEDRAAVRKPALPQGVWKLVSLERDGKVIDLAGRPLWWIIKGNKILYGGEELARATLDKTTTPPCLDLALRKPKRVHEGIFAVEKDTLRVCVNGQTEGVKDRPTGFDTKGHPDWRLLVFKRDRQRREDSTDGLPGFVGMAIKAVPDRTEVLVTDVIDGSPAQKAGLKKDDVVIAIDGQEPPDVGGAVKLVRQVKPGTLVTLRIRRGGKLQDLKIKAGVLPFNVLG